MENNLVSRPQQVKLWDTEIVKNLHQDYSDQHLTEQTVFMANGDAHENQRRLT